MGPVDDTTRADGRWTLREPAPTERADGRRQVVSDTHLPWRVDEPAVVLGRPFDAQGDGSDGVAAYVRRRRLEGARRQLMVDRRHPVAAIAAAWGFSDAPHISRAYRRHFGETPDTARQTPV